MEKFYENGLHFSCNGCSKCCRIDPGFVYLTKSDLDALSKKCELTPEQFIKAYCRWVQDTTTTDILCLREKKNYDCVFWKDGCTVYDARPVQCRAYPFWDYLLSCKQNWDAEASDCPGINNGQLHSKQEIETQLASTHAEPPITRQRPDWTKQFS
ncbi:MAG: YkgJ family cysteine cluster protein [Treponema sp.]|nr:YkgJ family cysteine cluster protein [Treponema sp.]